MFLDATEQTGVELSTENASRFLQRPILTARQSELVAFLSLLD
jgi:hypothetical protein